METNASQVLAALGDPTRRWVLERLARGPASAGELARGLPVTRPAVSQHLRVLREAALVSDRREGARRIYSLAPEGARMLREYAEMLWRSALADFKDAADSSAGSWKAPSAQGPGPQGAGTEAEQEQQDREC